MKIRLWICKIISMINMTYMYVTEISKIGTEVNSRSSLKVILFQYCWCTFVLPKQKTGDELSQLLLQWSLPWEQGPNFPPSWVWHWTVESCEKSGLILLNKMAGNWLLVVMGATRARDWYVFYLLVEKGFSFVFFFVGESLRVLGFEE